MAKKKKSFKKLITSMLFLVIIIMAVYVGGKLAFKTGYDFMGKAPVSNDASIVEVEIPEGSSTEKIAKILKEKGLIKSVTHFRIMSKLSEYDGKYQHGTFLLAKNMDQDTIMQELMKKTANKDTIRITIPEGYTIKQIAEKLEKEGVVTAEEFIEAANSTDYNYAFIQEIPNREIKLQGYLFPNTYEIYKTATAKQIVDLLLSEFDKVFNEEYKAKAKELGMSIDEIVTMASIIEREVKSEKERNKVAGVIYNRLNIGMKLEMCSTVIYALDKPRDFSKDKLLYSDLEVDSPYNTYLYAGLPKGPIANPGKASLEAALYPEKHDYLFFVLVNEQTGEHEFNKTLEGHNAAKNRN